MVPANLRDKQQVFGKRQEVLLYLTSSVIYLSHLKMPLLVMAVKFNTALHLWRKLTRNVLFLLFHFMLFSTLKELKSL